MKNKLKMNEDLYFDIASKIRLEAKVVPTMWDVMKVFRLIRDGMNLDDINFSLFDWCGINKIVIKVKG